jgi:hypothetical protein
MCSAGILQEDGHGVTGHAARGMIKMTTPLRIVPVDPTAEPAPSAPASLGERIQQHQAEARRLAREHVDVLEANLLRTHQIAVQIAEGGDAYPAGVRDIARRLSEDSAARALLLEALMARV